MHVYVDGIRIYVPYISLKTTILQSYRSKFGNSANKCKNRKDTENDTLFTTVNVRIRGTSFCPNQLPCYYMPFIDIVFLYLDTTYVLLSFLDESIEILLQQCTVFLSVPIFVSKSIITVRLCSKQLY